MQLSRANTVISWLVIISTTALVFIIMMSWRITNNTKFQVQQSYEVLQYDIFQQSIFLGRSVATLQRLINFGQDPKSNPLTRKEINAYLQAVIGHQSINIKLNEKILEQLPRTDPLFVYEQISQLQSRINESLEDIIELNRRLVAAPDTGSKHALIVANIPKLQDFINVLNEGIDVHSRVESTYFKIMKDGIAKAIENITLSLSMLIGLLFATIVLIVFYLTGQRRARHLLKVAYDDLEMKVRQRTSELHKVNAELHKAQHIAHLGFWKYDIQKDAIEWSEELYRIYGITQKDEARFSYGDLLNLVHPSDREHHNDFTKKMKTEGQATFEYRLIHSDGQVRTVWGQGETTYDSDGTPTTLFGVVQDITARKTAEIELEKTKIILEHAEKLAELGGWEWDIENDLWTMSDNWMRIHGASIKQMNTQTLMSYIFQEDKAMIEEAIEKALEGVEPYDIEHRIIREDTGAVRFIRAKGEVKKTASGPPMIMYGTAQDITEQKKAIINERQSYKLASIGTLAGGVAHDFNNILHIILGNSELALQEIPEWNPAREPIEEIRDSSLIAAGIVRQLLDFSRKSDQEFKPIGATTIIHDALKLIRSTTPSIISLNVDIPKHEITIIGDQVQLTQVVMNICSNASQAMEQNGGHLGVKVEQVYLAESDLASFQEGKPGEYLRIIIHDNGPGISEDIIEQIFDPYFTTKEIGKGSGMGLAVVHGIVNSHGGCISVDSTPGNGATFTLYFPVVGEKPVETASGTGAIPGGDESILLVDDESAIRKMVTQLLTRLGYTVEAFENPTDALKRFKQQQDKFDLVLTDMTMPYMTGVELTQEIRKIKTTIAVIICTGHSDFIDQESVKAMSIDGFIIKPIRIADMAKVVRKVLDREN